MPQSYNSSHSGCYVVKSYGQGNALGIMIPQVGQILSAGNNYIGGVVGVSGNIILFPSGINQYDFLCQALETTASGSYMWPSGAQDRVFGHTRNLNTAGPIPSGGVYMVGGVPHYYS